MSNYEWRLSGNDACRHVFRADDGYIHTHERLAVVGGDNDAIEQFFGPYEAFVAECGHVVPVAMLLTASAGAPCSPCLLLSGAASPSRPLGEWAMAPPPDHGACHFAGSGITQSQQTSARCS